MSLFITLVEEILSQDPDLEDADFHILDFSAPRTGDPRNLSIVKSNEVPRLDHQQKLKMLETFAEGYFQAMDILSGKISSTVENTRTDLMARDQDQADLFDG